MSASTKLLSGRRSRTYGFETRLITSRIGGDRVRHSLRYRYSWTLSRRHTTSFAEAPTTGRPTPARCLRPLRARTELRSTSRRTRSSSAAGVGTVGMQPSLRPSSCPLPRRVRGGLRRPELRGRRGASRGERREVLGVLPVGKIVAEIANLALQPRDVLEQPVDVAAGRHVEQVQGSPRCRVQVAVRAPCDRVGRAQRQ